MRGERGEHPSLTVPLDHGALEGALDVGPVGRADDALAPEEHLLPPDAQGPERIGKRQGVELAEGVQEVAIVAIGDADATRQIAIACRGKPTLDEEAQVRGGVQVGVQMRAEKFEAVGARAGAAALEVVVALDATAQVAAEREPGVIGHHDVLERIERIALRGARPILAVTHGLERGARHRRATRLRACGRRHREGGSENDDGADETNERTTRCEQRRGHATDSGRCEPVVALRRASLPR